MRNSLAHKCISSYHLAELLVLLRQAGYLLDLSIKTQQDWLG